MRRYDVIDSDCAKTTSISVGRFGSQENGRGKKGEVEGDIGTNCLETETGLAPVPPLGVVAEFSC